MTRLGAVWQALALVLLLSYGTHGCNLDITTIGQDKEDGTPYPGSKVLPGSSGSGPYAILQQAILSFETRHNEACLLVDSVGSGAAMSALWGSVNCKKKPIESVCHHKIKNHTVWGMGGGTFSDSDYETHEDLELTHIPAMAGPVVLIYLKDPKAKRGLNILEGLDMNLSLPVIGAIHKGKLQYWDDPELQILNPNVKLPHERITVWVREDKSGMTSTITEALSTHSPNWPEDAVGSKPDWPLNFSEPWYNKADGQNGIILGILGSTFSIGYVEVGVAKHFNDLVGTFQIVNPLTSMPVKATKETVQEAMLQSIENFDERNTCNLVEMNITGYPLSRFVYWYLKLAPDVSCYHTWLLSSFVNFTFGEKGQEIADATAGEGSWVLPPSLFVESRSAPYLNRMTCMDDDGVTLRPLEGYLPVPYQRVTSAFVDNSVPPWAFVLGGVGAFILGAGVLYCIMTPNKASLLFNKMMRMLFTQATFLLLGAIGELVDISSDIAVAAGAVQDGRIEKGVQFAYIIVCSISLVLSLWCFWLRSKLIREVLKHTCGVTRLYEIEHDQARRIVQLMLEEYQQDAQTSLITLSLAAVEDTPMLILNITVMLNRPPDEWSFVLLVGTAINLIMLGTKLVRGEQVVEKRALKQSMQRLIQLGDTVPKQLADPKLESCLFVARNQPKKWQEDGVVNYVFSLLCQAHSAARMAMTIQERELEAAQKQLEGFKFPHGGPNEPVQRPSQVPTELSEDSPKDLDSVAIRQRASIEQVFLEEGGKASIPPSKEGKGSIPPCVVNETLFVNASDMLSNNSTFLSNETFESNGGPKSYALKALSFQSAGTEEREPPGAGRVVMRYNKTQPPPDTDTSELQTGMFGNTSFSTLSSLRTTAKESLNITMLEAKPLGQDASLCGSGAPISPGQPRSPGAGPLHTDSVQSIKSLMHQTPGPSQGFIGDQMSSPGTTMIISKGSRRSIMCQGKDLRAEPNGSVKNGNRSRSSTKQGGLSAMDLHAEPNGSVKNGNRSRNSSTKQGGLSAMMRKSKDVPTPTRSHRGDSLLSETERHSMHEENYIPVSPMHKESPQLSRGQSFKKRMQGWGPAGVSSREEEQAHSFTSVNPSFEIS